MLISLSIVWFLVHFLSLKMNAAPTPSPTPLIQDDNNIDSDTDTIPDNAPEYYQPISAFDDDVDHSGHGESASDSDSESNHDGNSGVHCFVNGYCHSTAAENGISSLNLRDVDDDDGDDSEERRVEEEDLAMRRAFREDEDRRNAPLDPANVTRVVEAMRRVEFGGAVPDWAGRVSEDQWIDRLRRLRQLQTGPSTSV